MLSCESLTFGGAVQKKNSVGVMGTRRPGLYLFTPMAVMTSDSSEGWDSIRFENESLSGARRSVIESGGAAEDVIIGRGGGVMGVFGGVSKGVLLEGVLEGVLEGTVSSESIEGLIELHIEVVVRFVSVCLDSVEDVVEYVVRKDIVEVCVEVCVEDLKEDPKKCVREVV